MFVLVITDSSYQKQNGKFYSIYHQPVWSS